MKVEIYHNAKCSKSRRALEILEGKSNLQIEVHSYLEVGISSHIVMKLSEILKINVVDFMRCKEDEFKALNLNVTDNLACAQAIEKYPKLLERPIVVIGERGIIARPPEKLEELF